MILPWDQNENFQLPQVAQGIFRQSVAAVKRLVTNSTFIQQYYQAIRDLLNGPFREDVMNRQIDSVRFAFPKSTLDDMAAFEKAVRFLGGDDRFKQFTALRDPLLTGEESRFLKLKDRFSYQRSAESTG